MFRIIFLLSLAMHSFASDVNSSNDVFTSEALKEQIASKSDYKIAILPIQNATAFANLPFHFRNRLKEQLIAKGYSVIEFKVVDDALIEQGVQTTDQIGLVDFDVLAKASSADAVLSGIVETSTVKNIAIYSGYAFSASLKLQDRQAKTLWYSLSKRVAKRRIAIDPINMVLNVVLDLSKDKWISAIDAVGDVLMQDFPNGPIEVIEDDLLNQAITL